VSFRWIDVRAAFAVCALLSLVQAVLLWRFRRRLSTEEAPDAGPAPAAAVIVPFKGLSPGLGEAVRSLLDQRYPGPLEFLFVAASRNDPVYPELERIAAGSPAKIRILESKARPSQCSEVMLNLLHAVSQASEETQLLLFTDSDLQVPRDWALRLSAPLRDPSVGAATSVMLFAPDAPGLWSFLRMVWIGAGLPFFMADPQVCGQSMAFRKGDFDRFGVAGLWSRCITTDAPLDRIFRERGLKVAMAAGAAPVSREACTLREFLRVFNKWFVYCRTYNPLTWALLAGFLLAKLWVLFWALRPPVSWGLLAAALAFDMAYVHQVFAGLSRRFPDYFRTTLLPLAAALAMPAVFVFYLINLAVSVVQRDIRWGGYLYRIHGPQRIAVLESPR